ncbi:hypothetical protein MUY14_19885 [Amycolatopsis sp. FBCC-B4732]|uniref:hypothetical protein n=1 Tax=Amycolatopsis sp. FBCC-B4732 TaxID=3079339 RepID=UPI001FF11101|nr:hypothetical protein [Amycolatopsis sp. FBCC-B4732]UOX92771.1 hypothetical protein MUY14_19885 [Amycolatopsis sp. FBCC-B4732]
MTDFPPLPVLGKLTPAERELIEAARRGEVATPDAPVRAEVLRELLLGRRGPLDPLGVRVEGARIAGTLNLDLVEAGTGLALTGCVVVNPVSVRRARLPWLDLSGSRIAGFDGDGVRIGHDLRLTGVRATGSGEFGAICLRDARVGGRVYLGDAEVTSEDGPAVYLDGLACADLRCAGLRAAGDGELGAVRLLRANVTGQVVFDDAVLTNAGGPALHADGLEAAGDVWLTSAKITGAGEEGALRLIGARIGGEADFTDAALTNETGPALEADRLHAGDLRLDGVTALATAEDAAISLLGARIEGQFNAGAAVVVNRRGRGLSADGIRVGDSFHADGLKARASGEYGALCLLSAHVAGNLYLDGAELANDTGAALSGDRLGVDGNFRANQLTAEGSGEPGTIRLLGARIGGRVDLEGAKLTNDASPALYADGLHVGGSLDLSGVKATGAGDDGAILLHSVEITGQLLLDGAELANASGPAVNADDARVGNYVDGTGLRASASSEWGALTLSGMWIGGRIVLDDAEIRNDAGPALVADRAEVRESLVLRGIRATGAGEEATIRLLGARIAGDAHFSGAELAHSGGETLLSLEDVLVEGKVFLPVDVVCAKPVRGPHPGTMELDGFRFGALGAATWQEWLHLIRWHTAVYRPGPYQRLAAVERTSGHDGNARHVLIAQQRDLQRWAPEGIGGWPARRFHWLWGALAGYGYRARRTAAALLLAVLAAGGLGLWAGQVEEGGHHAAERVADFAAPAGTRCTTVELIGVGLDRGLPLSPGVRGRCDLNTGLDAGQVFTVAIWAVQAAIWALATLALVGYTGLVRKTG